MKLQFAAASLVLVTAAAFGATTAGPLGFDLGKTTVAAFRDRISAGTAPVEFGTHRDSRGKVFEVPAGVFDAAGLQKARFVFDERERLVAVELSFPKGFGNENTRRIADGLGAKYQEVSRNTPSVGHAAARYKAADLVVVLEAPHLAFECTVTYMTPAFEAQSNAGRARRKKAQERAFDTVL